MAHDRFVFLWHEMQEIAGRKSHYDLMFQQSEGLRTWAVEAIPSDQESVEAFELPLHREAYLDFEGEISGNRGAVTRFDQGTFMVHKSTESLIRLEIQGQRVRGLMVFEKCDASEDQNAQSWRVTFLAASTTL